MTTPILHVVHRHGRLHLDFGTRTTNDPDGTLRLKVTGADGDHATIALTREEWAEMRDAVVDMLPRTR